MRFPQEIERDDQAVLGPQYGSAYFHVRQALWTLSSYWDRYETLFGTSERVSVLNENSGTFWHAMQIALFDYVLLLVCRLTDPPRTGKKQNLTLSLLLELDPSPRKAELRRLVLRAEGLAEFARSWRNKRIAHNDFDEMTGVANGLAPATRNKVRNAIIGIHDVLRWVQLRHFDGDLVLLELGDDDTNEMMFGIADGNDAKQARMQALQRRDILGMQWPSYGWFTRGKNGGRYSKRIKLRVRRGGT